MATDEPAAREPTTGREDAHELWGELGRRVAFLRRAELFRDAPASTLTHVAAALRPVQVAAGDIVVRESDIGDQFFMVESGALRVTTEAGGRRHDIARLGPGEFFGEIALLGQSCRMATVQAEAPGQLWALGADEFQELVAREPDLHDAVRHAAEERQTSARSTVFELEERNLAALFEQTDRLRIGSSADNDIVLDSRLVASHHASVEGREDTYYLVDVTAGADTFVNGEPVRHEVELRDGDEIVLGNERLIFDRRELVHVLERRGVRIDAVDLVREVKGGKRLLNGVSLSILPGEFVAIVGGSGAGKTTLMDALSGVHPATTGQVLYNGYDYYADLDRYRHALGYVPQDDIIHTELPLRLTVSYSAGLRLPAGVSRADRDHAVDEALEILDLAHRADVKVGLLSGGQRKRASIAVELLTRPRVFFLDEPTSGLDPATEGHMMRLMRRLADDGSTVVLTTHATKNVMLCDRIVVLARDGHLAFFGSPARALRYFDVDTFDEIYDRLEGDDPPEEWARRFNASEDAALLRTDQTLTETDSALHDEHVRGLGHRLRTGLRQFRVLSMRNFATHLRDPGNLPQLVMPPVVFTLLMIVLFRSGVFEPDTPNPAAPMQLLFTFSFLAFLYGLLFSVQEIVKEYPIFLRERMVDVKVTPYVMSKTSFLVPYLVGSILFMTIVLWATDRLPDADLGLYTQLVVTLVLTALAGMTLSLFTSAFVKTSQAATDLLTPWIGPQVLFAGALLAVPAMNAIGRFISAIAAVRWSFEGVSHVTDLTGLFAASPSPIGRALLLQYETSFVRGIGETWLILGAFVVVPLVLAVVVLHRRSTLR